MDLKRLRELARKLRALSTRPGGTAGRLRPPISERTLRRFERTHRLVLPPGYRAFLGHVANGAPGPAGRLPPLASAFDRDRVVLLPRPFPYSRAQAIEILQLRATEDELHGGRWSQRGSMPGVLDVSEWGSGCRHCVVIGGPLADQVWEIGHYPGWSFDIPMGRRTGDDWEPLAFLDWYEAWLDRSLRAGALQTNPARAPAAIRVLRFAGAEPPVPSWAFDRARVEELSLWHNAATEISGRLGALRRLKIVELHCRKLVALPRELGRLDQLERLTAWCSLETLPPTIGRLAQLRWLDLQSNSLRELPSSFGGLHALEWLRLAGNRELAALPDSFGELRRLRVLHLETTALHRLPATCSELPELRSLYLAWAERVDAAHTCRVVAPIATLRRLSLTVTEIPRELGRLRQLTTLVLVTRDGAEPIAHLPPELGELADLESLMLPVLAPRADVSVLGELRRLRTLDFFGQQGAPQQRQLERLLPDTVITRIGPR